mmetsp:Transcript_46778/g.149362  ORF Transcript_46778/g.149362 Transcript_46778/m.149362 type:complete len:214 (+) Transcript_46778:191-832(+)
MPAEPQHGSLASAAQLDARPLQPTRLLCGTRGSCSGALTSAIPAALVALLLAVISTLPWTSSGIVRGAGGTTTSTASAGSASVGAPGARRSTAPGRGSATYANPCCSMTASRSSKCPRAYTSGRVVQQAPAAQAASGRTTTAAAAEPRAAAATLTIGARSDHRCTGVSLRFQTRRPCTTVKQTMPLTAPYPMGVQPRAVALAERHQRGPRRRH